MCSGRRRSNGRRIEIGKKVRQRQSAAGSFYATNSPGLSCYLSRHCEIATGAKRPRNDKLGGIAPMNLCHNRCQPARRSLTAATDAIGLCVFSVARANCKCLPEIATAPSGPRNDKSGNLHGRRNCFKICNCQWRSGSAATDAIGLCVFSVARANCKCLPEIATAPSGPRNDTSGECGGAPEHFRG